MQKNRIIAIIIIIFAILILGFAFLLIIIQGNKAKANQNVEIYNESNIYILTNYKEKYGISKIDGTTLIEPNFDKVVRVDDYVYLKNDKESYIYSLNDGEYVTLDNKESGISVAYSATDNKLLPYFILSYGTGAQDSIYRIYSKNGVKYTSEDYTTLDAAKKVIKAKVDFSSTSLPDKLANDYNLVKEVPYKTQDGKHQYIVTRKNSVDVAIKGIVDETGKIILDFNYKNIDVVKNDAIALKVTDKDDNDFIFTQEQKLGKIDNGFDVYGVNGGGYLQMRGNIVNKIYDAKLDVAIEGIYNYPNDFNFYRNSDDKLMVLLKKQDGKYYLYNLTDGKDEIDSFYGITADYLKTYSGSYKNSSALVKDGKQNLYILDLENMKTARVLVNSQLIYSPLDYGMVYENQ